MIWCAEHGHTPDPESPASCWLWTEGGLGSTLQIRGEPKPCRMVEALLIVKENGRPAKALKIVEAYGTYNMVKPEMLLDALASVGEGQ